jgi:hypothetical protein
MLQPSRETQSSSLCVVFVTENNQIQSREQVSLRLVSDLPREMKTMSMGGVSKNVMGLVLSIRIMEEASTAQLNNSNTQYTVQRSTA